ncbi:hypothetical protein ACFV3R_25645 [Streptomyces sp. NPDC059740]|uniref:hypothetical protein n=1 Tax=Streptomyces sp. NPDC059740 TaxID=3346926 RepID=UPI00364EAB7C
MDLRDVACTGKARYITRAQAKKAATAIRREGGDHLCVYQCRFCSTWHLGGRPGQAKHLRRTHTGMVPLAQYLQERQT